MALRHKLRLFIGTTLFLALTILTFAQSKAGDSDSAKRKNAPALAVQVEPSQVKFNVQRTVLSYRFTVKNEAGETVFDSGPMSDAELHWKLADANGAALPSGLFLYELAIQETADSATQSQRGHFIIERAADRVWVTTQEPQGLSVSGSQISVARDGGTLTGGARGEGKPTSGAAVEGKQTKNDKTDTQGKLSIDTGASGGTTGYIARWTSPTVLQDSVIFQDGTGRVGIGTTTPGDTLEVAGATNIGGSFVNGMNFVNTAGSGFRRSQFTMSAKDGTVTKGLFGFFADSSTNPTTNQQFTIHDWIANQSRLVINPSGNIGIGSSSPTYKLHVEHSGNTGILSKSTNSFSVIDIDAANGDAALRLARAGVNQWLIRNTPANDDFQIFELGVVGGGERMRIENNTGNVVIAKALSSSALRQELTANTPNIINGFIGTGSGGATPGNRVMAGVVGASIGGGFNGGVFFPTEGTITGDNTNRVTDWFGTVGGGAKNRAGDDAGTLDDAYFATVGGGYTNTASGSFATVGGGANNAASGTYSTVPGGSENTALGAYSFAAGLRAKANHQGAFVWGDSTFADFASTATNQFLIRATGNVGINTTAPESALSIKTATSTYGLTHTDGTIKLTTYVGGGGNGGFLGTQSNHPLHLFAADSGPRLTVTTTGNVGIGTLTPDQMLSVNGNASKALSGTTWSVFSDERLKTIHGKFTPGLQALMKLQPIWFTYKPDNALGLQALGETVGFSAQAVAAVLPEAVTKSESGYLQLNSDPILWTMLNSIKEQQAQIQQLMQANRLLQQRLTQVERRGKTRRR